MSRTAWVLTDAVLSETYVFPVNPFEDGGSYNVARETNYEVSAAHYQDNTGRDRVGNLVFFGSDVVPRFSYTGHTYTLEQLEALETWCRKDYALKLKDDLGRESIIAIENFAPERVRKASRPAKHSYTFSGIIVEIL